MDPKAGRESQNRRLPRAWRQVHGETSVRAGTVRGASGRGPSLRNAQGLAHQGESLLMLAGRGKRIGPLADRFSHEGGAADPQSLGTPLLLRLADYAKAIDPLNRAKAGAS